MDTPCKFFWTFWKMMYIHKEIFENSNNLFFVKWKAPTASYCGMIQRASVVFRLKNITWELIFSLHRRGKLNVATTRKF